MSKIISIIIGIGLIIFGTVFFWTISASTKPSPKRPAVQAGNFDSCTKHYCEKLIATESRVYSILVEDFNHDGNADIFPHGHDPEDGIYISDGTDFTKGSYNFPRSDRHTCTTSDVNNDGNIDMFCSVGADRGSGLGSNELFLGDDSGGLTLSDNPHGAEDNYGRGREVAFFNFDNDEFLDLIVTNWGTRDDDLKNENTIYRNMGNATFEPVKESTILEAGSACVKTMDWNKDGRDDILICGKNPGTTKILQSHENGFTDLTPLLGLNDIQLSVLDGEFIDLDSDGVREFVMIDFTKRISIYKINSTDPFPFSSDPQKIEVGTFMRQEQYKHIHRGKVVLPMEVFDFNGDGNLDFYIGINTPSTQNPDNIVGDIVVYGPDFTEYFIFPEKVSGTGAVAKLNSTTLVVSQAGSGWPGEIKLVSGKF